MRNLYWIIDKQGKKIKFQPNWAQEHLEHNRWYLNIILKARQLGISTYISLVFLDYCLFHANQTAGIIAHTKEDAEYLFKRIKFAYDSLPPALLELRTSTTDSARELQFNNGSCIRVGTSMRGSTLQFLQISEFGKICAKFPDKAEEIITGSLNTIAPGQYIFIESTAEGKEGYFYEICKQAQLREQLGHKLTPLDYKFFFYPWWQDPSYRIGNILPMSEDLVAYFDHLKGQNIDLDIQQKNWYILKYETQGDNMRREFPSTAEESWEQSINGAYYSRHLTQTRIEKRIGKIPYDTTLPVYTAWDLGYNDLCAIWFIQLHGKEIRLIDYVEGDQKSLAEWCAFVLDKPYHYEKHIAPHDIQAHELSSGKTRQAQCREFGINFIVAPKTKDVVVGIDCVRGIFNRCWFDETKCEKGIKALEHYKKEWDDKHGCWKNNPLHDWASHGADAFRTLATGLDRLYPRNKPPSSPQAIGPRIVNYPGGKNS